MGNLCAGDVFPSSKETDSSEYLQYKSKLQAMLKNEHFKEARGDGFHVLFKDGEMETYFQRMKDGEFGKRFQAALPRTMTIDGMQNIAIWRTLLKTLQFDGVDFEHTYGIVGGAGSDIKMYSFPETVILAHTQLIVPVMQYVAPLNPKLPDDGSRMCQSHGWPILAVGMVGDCVKGNFFKHLQDNHPRDAEVLLKPDRLGSKIQSLVEALGKSPFQNISIQASLPGAGAFGGNGEVLAKEFVARTAQAISPQGARPFSEILLYGAKDWYTGPLKNCPQHVQDLVKAVGFGSKEEQNRMGECSPTKCTRVIVAGFDPVSLAPHGVQYRAISLEGQLSHGTDLLARIKYYKTAGRLVSVAVERGEQKDPKDGSTTMVEEYKAWRYVEGKGDGQFTLQQKEERRPNGDCLSGWALASGKMS